ncbi:hypothetical protein L1049_002838 [Liquidambar formosana]|uniref:Uncharacterized protein n=1 Tax=Liquidambar formosana TaxID=63359 RepID=A0AAP0NIU3_LIQFO
MFHFICKALIHHRAIDSKTTHVRFLQTIPCLNSISNTSTTTDPKSLTVSYLVNSCGLSSETALSASKMVAIESTERPDKVLELLRTFGFTKTHIIRLISKHPPLILVNPEKILRPKIEFFESLGITGPDLPKILCSNKQILLSSLKNQIIPTFDFLRGFVKTNENLICALKQSTRVVRCNIQKVMEPNILTLRAHGVPERNIARLIVLQPQSLMLRIDLFKEVASSIREMGFEPMSRSFILAIRSMSMISKTKWEKKKKLFLDCGWSEDEFFLAFKVQPLCMLCSEKKIRELMEFFVNKVGLKPSDAAKCPNLFLTSLERRLIPRCSVLQVLISKGLIKKDVNIVWVLNSTKEKFENKFVKPYKEDAPEVIKAYQSKIGFQGFNVHWKIGTKKKEA